MALRHGHVVAALASALLLSAVSAMAADAPADARAPAAEAKPSDNPPEIELTAEERAERNGRKACKVAICAAFRTRKTDGGDISCDIVKSWRKEQLAKLVGKLKVSWPYAGVRCTSTVKLKRADIVKAMTELKADLQIDQHSVACVVAREREAATDIKFDLAPKVTFEDGKAKKAQINWGKIEAPALIKSALWTATAADNAANLLSNTLVEDINDFVSKKCDEVKNDWAAK